MRTLDDARHYIQTGPLASYASHGFGLNLVELKGSGIPIGMCGILKRDTLPDPDLGYALLPEYWSLGYASEAATAITTQARQILHLPRLLAVSNADNTASIKLLGKLDFRFVRPVQLSEDEPELKLYLSDLLPCPAGSS